MKRLILAALLAASSAAAQTTPEVYRLSPAEAERAKAEAAAAPRPLFDDSLPLMSRDNKIHGEVGVGIGTGGYSSVFGTAVVPLGDDATAVLSFQQSRLNGGRFGRGRYYPY